MEEGVVAKNRIFFAEPKNSSFLPGLTATRSGKGMVGVVGLGVLS